jgi:hypothetical protein
MARVRANRLTLARPDSRRISNQRQRAGQSLVGRRSMGAIKSGRSGCRVRDAMESAPPDQRGMWRAAVRREYVRRPDGACQSISQASRER